MVDLSPGLSQGRIARMQGFAQIVFFFVSDKWTAMYWFFPAAIFSGS